MRFMLCLFLAACVDDPEAPVELEPGPWTLPAVLTPTADNPEQLDAWRAEVDFNIRELAFAVAAGDPDCTPPFVIGAGGHEVRLATTCAGLELGVAGGQDGAPDGPIVVVGTPRDNLYRSPLRGIIQHELGHALGLPHADPFAGPSAMSVPPGTQLYETDAAAIAARIGCR